MKNTETPTGGAPAPTHLRLSKEMDAAIIMLAEKLEISKQEALRLALRLGLDVMKTNEFDATKAALSASIPGDTMVRAFKILAREPDTVELPGNYRSTLNEDVGRRRSK